MIPRSIHRVTTASSIDGWEIEDHLGVVASHAVAGTGLVSDFFAGFSDIFGGRSESYRRQLESLYRDTILDLLAQAETRGGNWLVGVRIDLDEVSGKGTQMFMITGLGTAVRARRTLRPTNGPQGDHLSVPLSEVEVMATRQALLMSLENDSTHLSEADWTFMVEQRVEDACPAVLRRYATSLSEPVEGPVLRRKAAALFRVVSPTLATEVLYDGLRTPRLASASLDLISDCGLCSYPHVIAALSAEDHEVRRHALQTLKLRPPAFSASSLADIETLLDRLGPAFPNRATLTEKKGMLGGTKQVWQCQCGQANATYDSYCTSCSRDQFGFRPADLKPPQAQSLLHVTQTALLAILSGRQAATS